MSTSLTTQDITNLKTFVSSHLDAPDAIFNYVQSLGMTNTTIAQTLGYGVEDVKGYFESHGLHSADLDQMGTTSPIIQSGLITDTTNILNEQQLADLKSFVSTHIDTPDAIFNQAQSLGLTNNDLANTLGFHVEEVKGYFESHGLHSAELDHSVIVNTITTGAINTIPTTQTNVYNDAGVTQAAVESTISNYNSTHDTNEHPTVTTIGIQSYESHGGHDD